MGPGRVDCILEATGDKKALRFFRLCAFCGREPELPPPSPVKKRKKRHLLLDHQRRRLGYNARL